MGESLMNVLAKIQWTFASWRKSSALLAKLQWTFANWRMSTVFLSTDEEVKFFYFLHRLTNILY
jgi:hypothetical protein